MAVYTADVLTKFAGKLEGQAGSIIVVYGVAGTVVGLAAGLFLVKLNQGFEPAPTEILAALVGLIPGLLAGVSRAFALRVKAQMVLCSVEQERHLGIIAAELQKRE